jgi:hypothetical protein
MAEFWAAGGGEEQLPPAKHAMSSLLTDPFL